MDFGNQTHEVATIGTAIGSGDSRIQPRRICSAASKIEKRRDVQVSICFIGGNETQRAYVGELQARIEKQYPQVLLEFEMPGWSSNWGRIMKRIESAIYRADAIVVMRFIRTEFGKKIRRLAGTVSPKGYRPMDQDRSVVEPRHP